MQTPKCTCPGHAALENQLRELKLKLFWKRNSTTQLKLAMQCANQDRCACMACAVSGRMDDDNEAVAMNCVFKPFFDALLAECGLGSSSYADNEGVCQHESDDSGNYVHDNDTHFVHIGHDDWVSFTYGAKLWRATSDDDAELQKLARLFARLLE